MHLLQRTHSPSKRALESGDDDARMEEERSVGSAAPSSGTTATAIAVPVSPRDGARMALMEQQVEQLRRDMDGLKRGQLETAEYVKSMKCEIAQEVETKMQQAAGALSGQLEQSTAQLKVELTLSLNASLGASLAEVIRAQLAAFVPQRNQGH